MDTCVLIRMSFVSCAYFSMLSSNILCADMPQSKFELQMHIRPKLTQMRTFVKSESVVFEENLKTTASQNHLIAEFLPLGIIDNQLFLKVRVKKAGARVSENFADFEFSVSTKTRNHFLTAETKTGEILEIHTRPVQTNMTKIPAKNIYALRNTPSDIL